MSSKATFFLLGVIAAGCGGKSSTSTPDGGGGSPSLTSCTRSSECIVLPESCCGSCGTATRDDARAVNSNAIAAHPDPACQDQGCPACFAPQDPTLLATCRSGNCELVDQFEHASTACSADEECRVRTRDCCECGGDTSVSGLVGVSDETSFTAIVCDPETACPECAPIYPPEVTVGCDGGRCTVHDPRNGR